MDSGEIKLEAIHPQGNFIEVGAHRLWYEIEGTGEPLLLLAGGPANSHLIFHPNFSAIAAQFQLIYLDYFGRGRSDGPPSLADVTFRGDVEDVANVIKALGFDQISIYGFSYGGMIAQALALSYPQLVKKLVLANSLHSPQMWQRNHENINRELANQFPELWQQILTLRAQGYRSSEPKMQELFRMHSPLVRFYNPDNRNKILSEPGSRNEQLYFTFVGDDIEFFIGGEVAKLPDFRPHLKELTMPLLVIAGRYDRALYPLYQQEFKQYAPQAEFVILEKSGSFAHIEEPQTLFSLLQRFLLA